MKEVCLGRPLTSHFFLLTSYFSPLTSSRTPFVEDDQPAPAWLPAPDRAERCDPLATGIEDRPAAQRQGAGGEHLDEAGLPGERRLRSLVELPPRLDHFGLTPEYRCVAEEDRLGRQEPGESVQIPARHRGGEAAFR